MQGKVRAEVRLWLVVHVHIPYNHAHMNKNLIILYEALMMDYVADLRWCSEPEHLMQYQCWWKHWQYVQMYIYRNNYFHRLTFFLIMNNKTLKRKFPPFFLMNMSKKMFFSWSYLITVPLAPPAVVSMTLVVRLTRRSSWSRPSRSAHHSRVWPDWFFRTQPPETRSE